MTDAQWLRDIADNGWHNDEWSPRVKAMLHRVADRLDKVDRLCEEHTDLLTACEAMVAHFEHGENNAFQLFRAVRAAIERAKGTS